MAGWMALGFEMGPPAMWLPPLWPRERRWGEPRRRWDARPERWLQETESFEGATVLDDLEPLHRSDVSGATAIVARYAALRLVIRALDSVDPALLIEERIAAAEYLGGSEAFGLAERAALATMIALAGRFPRRELASALLHAGEAASLRGHGAGAFALARAAYRLALDRGWTAEAARAAGQVEALARAGGGRRSERLWRRRAAVLAGRLALEQAASDEST